MGWFLYGEKILMGILENELVWKYFGTKHTGCPEGCNYDHFDASSKRVLDAMQQPIRKGERYLNCHAPNDRWAELVSYEDITNYHPYHLRLPDAHQKQECKYCGAPLGLGRNEEDCVSKPTPSPEKCKCTCHKVPLDFKHDCCGLAAWFDNPKDAVEDKIKEICEAIDDFGHVAPHKLRDLVRIAREIK